MIIDCISDLHGHQPKLEGGDLLIVAGDCTAHDKVPQWVEFYAWLNAQNYRMKVYIGGNHDNYLAQCISDYESCKMGVVTEEGFVYLCDSGCEFEGLKIWGSPWTRKFYGQNLDCMAFALDNYQEMKEKWCLIPEDTDILITHSPPFSILDRTRRERTGCNELLRAVCRIRPKLHVFGHIHEGYGKEERDGIIYVNASQMDEDYFDYDRPVRVILEGKSVCQAEGNGRG